MQGSWTRILISATTHDLIVEHLFRLIFPLQDGGRPTRRYIHTQAPSPWLQIQVKQYDPVPAQVPGDADTSDANSMPMLWGVLISYVCWQRLIGLA
jgi:hypothetical protein